MENIMIDNIFINLFKNNCCKNNVNTNKEKTNNNNDIYITKKPKIGYHSTKINKVKEEIENLMNINNNINKNINKRIYVY